MKWGQQFDAFVLLDSNFYKEKYSNFDFICATMPNKTLSVKHEKNAFDKLESFQKNIDDWIFGHISYDLKNDVEKLSSENIDGVKFPLLFFFQPKIIFFLRGNKLEISFLSTFKELEITDILGEILNIEIKENTPNIKANVQSRIKKETYLSKVEKIKKHIKAGNIYEMNFCQEFFSENTCINPIDTYLCLNKISHSPFGAYYKVNNNYVISASPERFIKKINTKIISQPIKGTAKRDENTAVDMAIKESLKNDKKEKAENIMIVDLVRNDLSKTALKNSVMVEELCKVYTFKQVHQMISTISSTVDKNISPVEVIKKAFPMGSMTGAPKLKAMQLIEAYEHSKRGIYSGSIGYFAPNNDFDFNVIIRSILYNEDEKYVSFSVGGAITDKSIPEKEYEETMLKAKAMFKIFE